MLPGGPHAGQRWVISPSRGDVGTDAKALLTTFAMWLFPASGDFPGR